MRGQLGVGQPDGSLSFREVPGVECNEVIDAMALIAALTFDLAAKTEVLPPPPPETEVAETPSEPEADAAPPQPKPLGFALVSQFGLRSALGPNAALAASLEAALTFLKGELQPSLRLGGHAGRGAQLKVQAGDARFSLLAARLSGCPTRWSIHENWGVIPCAFAEIGVLEGAGTRITIPITSRVFWAAAGFALHSELKLGGPLWLAGEASAFFPLRHDSFRFEPNLPENALFQIPSVGGYAALGLGLHFY